MAGYPVFEERLRCSKVAELILIIGGILLMAMSEK
jgi:multidrug transporter EmrE-like cation transporter